MPLDYYIIKTYTFIQKHKKTGWECNVKVCGGALPRSIYLKTVLLNSDLINSYLNISWFLRS